MFMFIILFLLFFILVFLPFEWNIVYDSILSFVNLLFITVILLES